MMSTISILNDFIVRMPLPHPLSFIFREDMKSVETSTILDRAWLWQLCTEFGFFHSTSSKTAGPFFGGQDKVPIS